MVDNYEAAGFGGMHDVINFFDPFTVVKQNFAMLCDKNLNLFIFIILFHAI